MLQRQPLVWLRRVVFKLFSTSPSAIQWPGAGKGYREVKPTLLIPPFGIVLRKKRNTSTLPEESAKRQTPGI